MSQDTINVVVYPNPNNGQFTVAATTDNAIAANIVICNSIGAIMIKQPWNLQKGNNSLKMDQRQWPAGTYILLVRKGETILRQVKFMIQHSSVG